jgi:GNAT superfamily N-acetyltransferase
MTDSFSLLIRDGLEQDFDSCLRLDHQYVTEFVWKMSIHEEAGQWEISFKKERLPRPLEAEIPAEPQRLRSAVEAHHCFLVAAQRENSEILGYLTMRKDAIYRTALIQDLLISRPYRQRGIGSRLLKVARQWAKEQQLNRMMIELQTKNFPGIAFCRQSGFTFCGYNDQYFPNQDIAVFFSQSLR